jgi:uncharacterized protein YbjT (DUF2867 family)
VRALLDAVPHNTDHVITGPDSLSYADAAAVITEITGRPVWHRPVSTAAMTDRLVSTGLSTEFAAMLTGLDEDIRHDAEDRFTSTIPDIIGRSARPFAEFVSAHPEAFTA